MPLVIHPESTRHRLFVTGHAHVDHLFDKGGVMSRRLSSGKVHPFGHGRDTFTVDHKKHVPAGRRNVLLSWYLRTNVAKVTALEWHIDDPLSRLTRVCGCHRTSQLDPLDILSLRSVKRDRRTVQNLHRRGLYKGPRAFEQVGRMKDFKP